MRTIIRLTVVLAAATAVRAAWARWAQGPHRSVPGAPVLYPPMPPRRADAPATATEDYRRPQA